MAPAPPLVGDKFERLYREADQDGAFVLLTDRMFPLTQAWDQAIWSGLKSHPQRVLWWQCHSYDGVTAPILSPECRNGLPQMFSGLFPFWFDDNWLEEVDLLAHGLPRIRVPAFYGGERSGKSQNFRDYPFWVEVFIKTRPRRLTLAKQAADLAGVPWQDRPELIKWLARRDALWRDRAKEVERHNRTDQPPDARYLAARRRAELIIAEEQAA